MATRNPVSTANLMGYPLRPILITLPIGFFIATLLFELVFLANKHGDVGDSCIMAARGRD